MDGHLTLSELYALFGRNDAEIMRWHSAGDAAEYLNVICYLVQRSNLR